MIITVKYNKENKNNSSFHDSELTIISLLFACMSKYMQFCILFIFCHQQYIVRIFLIVRILLKIFGDLILMAA